MVNFVEDVGLSGTRRTKDGYLVADVKCARTGIQQYLGSELGIFDKKIINVYRPEKSVFSSDSIATFTGKPITDNHPKDPVTAKNWKDYAVGNIGEGVMRDGEYVRVPIVLMDANIIDKVENGKREISMGYEMDLRWEAGVTDSGEEYDAVMENLKMNHLAIVDKGRAGHECRVGDSTGHKEWGAAPILTHDKGDVMSNRTVIVDGLSVATTDQGAQAIEKLMEDRNALQAKIETKDAEMAQSISAKDKELAARDAEIFDLKSKVLDAAALDAKVKERSDLISAASKIAKDVDFTGMNDTQIKAAAVESVRGKGAMDGQSADYIQGSFDIVLDSVKGNKNDAFQNTLMDGKKTVTDNGQAAYQERLENAWK